MLRRLAPALCALALLAVPAAASAKAEYGFFNVSAVMTYSGQWATDNTDCGIDTIWPHGTGTQQAVLATVKPVPMTVFGLNSSLSHLTVYQGHNTGKTYVTAAGLATQTAAPLATCAAADGDAYAACNHANVPFTGRIVIGIDGRLQTTIDADRGFDDLLPCAFDAGAPLPWPVSEGRAQGQRIALSKLARAKVGKPVTFTAHQVFTNPEYDVHASDTVDASVTFTLTCRPKSSRSRCPKHHR